MTWNRPELYFPWISDSLSYDCLSCGARCCRELDSGTTAIKEDWNAVKAEFPELSLYSFFHPGDFGALGAIELKNPGTGCAFLLPDQLCAIQSRMGRRSKPWSCKLFPFSSITRSGRFAVVSVNWSDALACPFEVSPPGTGKGISHSSIRAELDGLGEGHPALRVYPGNAPGLEREMECLVKEEAGLRDGVAELMGQDVSPLQMIARATNCGQDYLEERLAWIQAELPFPRHAHERIRAPSIELGATVGTLLPLFRWEIIRMRPQVGYRGATAAIPENFLLLFLYAFSLHQRPRAEQLMRLQRKLEPVIHLMSLFERRVKFIPPHGLRGNSVEASAIHCILEMGAPLTLIQVIRAALEKENMAAVDALPLLGSLNGLNMSVYADQ